MDSENRRSVNPRALKLIVEGTASVTGEQFFARLVRSLAKVLNVNGAWVTEYLEETQHLRALAFWLKDQFVPHYEYPIEGTPCEPVIRHCELFAVMDNVVELFPNDPDLPPLNAVSYMGAPLLDNDGVLLGHLAVLDSEPLTDLQENQWLMQIFATRAAAELQRIYAVRDIEEREEQLNGLLDSAMDAIVELDRDLTITRINPAAAKLLHPSGRSLRGRKFQEFLDPECESLFLKFTGELHSDNGSSHSLWIPQSLRMVDESGRSFPVEASLSQYEMHGNAFFTLILRNVLQRVRAEQTIRSLLEETSYLREELAEFQGSGEIVGQSAPVLAMLDDIRQVAETDATVLIHGETGTGKELAANAIHRASPRMEKPFVKVNCAAIPSTLMESEFFGHEKGAFTGATSRRDGRFTLADGGTIFLDEVGELPVELQAKLLRVLQEGDFEPVGSSVTRHVDVRVIAATNRDLLSKVREGEFREDLYYRLNVFPVQVPPLRDRGEDIPLLASLFARKFGKKIGRDVQPLTPHERDRLKSYDWPGNVRELQNVIERAVILSQDGRLDLDRALPSGIDDQTIMDSIEEDRPILTSRQLKELERENILRALSATNWKISGKDGAAELLNMPSTTLSSRMKSLGIERDR